MFRTRQNKPVATQHDFGEVIPPTKLTKRRAQPELLGPRPHCRVERTGPNEYADHSRVKSAQLCENINRKKRVFFRHHAPGKQQKSRVAGKAKFAAEGVPITTILLEARRIDAVVVHEIPSVPPSTTSKKT